MLALLVASVIAIPVSGGAASAEVPGYDSIAAGRYHTCAVTDVGGVQCWGSNASGQLGDGSMADSNRPVDVTGSGGAVASVAAGQDHSCALLEAGTVMCWGGNAHGQLGNGTTVSSTAPVAVAGLTGVEAISAGGEATCALLEAGAVACWGDNTFGQLGNGANTDASTPVAVTDLTDAVEIATGGFHSCALADDGSVACWGWNGTSQLGNGTDTDSNVPVSVSGLTDASTIAAGDYHSCAGLGSGGAVCWGWNPFGQLGNGTPDDSSVPVAVTGLGEVDAMTGGAYHTCAVLEDQTARCWGANFVGQLGIGSGDDSNVPAPVSGLSDVVGIAAGEGHSCAVLDDGVAKCWGWNSYGQLGSGSNEDSSVPVAVGSAGLLPQTIDLVPPPASVRFGAPRMTLNATATSGLPVSFTAGPLEVCDHDASRLHFNGAGTCEITASQDGDDTYEAAAPSTAQIDVMPAAVTAKLIPTKKRIRSGQEFTIAVRLHKVSPRASGPLDAPVQIIRVADGEVLATANLQGRNRNATVKGTLTLTGAPRSVTKIRAAYLGNANFSDAATRPSAITLLRAA